MSEKEDDEVGNRRDEVVKRMLATPPKPKEKKGREPKPAPEANHKDGKSGGKRSATGALE